jgi:hypothetical protein
MRLLPTAVIAPFASSLGDRFRRERFLLGVVLLGAAALVVSAAGALMDATRTTPLTGSGGPAPATWWPRAKARPRAGNSACARVPQAAAET